MTFRYLILFILLSNSLLAQQKVNADSLLTVVLKDIKDPLLLEKVEKNCRTAIKYSPKYYDFHLVMGQLYQKKNVIDSTRKYFNIVIDKSPNYKDAYLMLGRYEVQQKNKKNALNVVNKGLFLFPDDSELKKIKINALLITNSNEETKQVIDSLLIVTPKDTTLIKYKKEFESGNDFNK